MISGAKIQPLDSETKANVPLDTSSRGSAGTDRTIDQARIDPLGGAGEFQCSSTALGSLLIEAEKAGAAANSPSLLLTTHELRKNKD